LYQESLHFFISDETKESVRRKENGQSRPAVRPSSSAEKATVRK